MRLSQDLIQTPNRQSQKEITCSVPGHIFILHYISNCVQETS